MELILKFMGGLLGLIVPLLFAMSLLKGIPKSGFDREKKLKYRQILISSIAGLTIFVWVLSLAKILDYHKDDHIPRFAIPLIVFSLIGLLVLKNGGFRKILSAIPLSSLVGVQVFRFAGSAFLIITHLKILPSVFQLAAYGDVVTGTLALLASISLSKKSRNSKSLFWLFSIVGLVDLLNVAFLLLLYYPLWNHAIPSSEGATQFSLVLIPALVAPIALLLHSYAIFNAVIVKDRQQPASVAQLLSVGEIVNN